MFILKNDLCFYQDFLAIFNLSTQMELSFFIEKFYMNLESIILFFVTGRTMNESKIATATYEQARTTIYQMTSIGILRPMFCVFIFKLMDEKKFSAYFNLTELLIKQICFIMRIYRFF